ncbi:unnamed protein product, partial [Phaeothamnion confervicola]
NCPCKRNSKRLCGNKECSSCLYRSFASFDKAKVAAWSSRNPDLPHQVALGCNGKRWFNCSSCSHEFEGQLSNMTSAQRSWCPYCSHPQKKLCGSDSCSHCVPRSFAGFEDSSKVASWSSRNTLQPHEVLTGSQGKFWFDCEPCGHVFEAAISHVTKSKTWCPYCAPNPKLCDASDTCEHCLPRSFAGFEDADKVNAWSPRNPDRPSQVTLHSSCKRLFHCSLCDHDFDMSIAHITSSRRSWCYFCSGHRICENSDVCATCLPRTFAGFDNARKIAAWSAKNMDKPHQIAISSREKRWFDCDVCGHDFQATLNNVTMAERRWCSYCARKLLCEASATCTFCYPRSFASYQNAKIVADWSSRNPDLPHQVFMGCNDKKWFQCSDCNHEWQVAPSTITGQGVGCPYCANSKMCEETDCIQCFPKSFAGFAEEKHVMAWSSRNSMQAHQVFRGSSNKFWFNCDTCKHEFDAAPSAITALRGGTWCRYCAGNQLCSDAACTYCLNRSFAGFHDSSKIAAWSNLNSMEPRQVSKGSNQRCWFDCSICGHVFDKAIICVTNGDWCTYCTGRK